jgi:proton-dependent oligopeptide transporter, POT family
MTKQRKHPAALPFLFLSEMWERFGYYLMIGIFTFYLKDQVNGFQFSEAEASNLYGTFIALVFFTPFIGGLLADRLLGYRLPIIIGGILMGIGYCTMSIHSVSMLYTSMVLVILGNGLFKPNISTLLGNLYNEERFKARKDEGYNIFYMGINIGAFICNIVSAILINVYGFGAAFIAAGIGMFIGVAIFMFGTRHYAHVDKVKPKVEGEDPLWKVLAIVLLPALAFAFIAFQLPVMVKDKVTDAFLFACIPVLFFFGYIWYSANKQDRRAIGALLAIFLAVIPFWAIFKQNGSTLNTWAENYTDREAPKAITKGLLFMKLVEEKKMIVDTVESKMLDKHFRPVFPERLAFQYPKYFKNMSDKEKPNEGESVYLFNSNLFQSVNPFWVIALTPLVLALFKFLRRKGREPSSPNKLAIGLFITALSCLVMVGAVYASGNGVNKASYWWFFATYGVVTVGELFLSPIGLSIVSKLSPPRLMALMMGGWFISTSIGNKLSGVLSSLWDGYEQKSNFFLVNFGLLCVATLILVLMLRWLNRIFKEYKV